ncbi:hypothetical protein [Streptosporangium sp. NPDC000396]|uniref:hypothetical protein n=1 Tax=Streptosporangium sp. NPDC000396 TaxID=3366185 RepID=UPI003677F998
MSESAEMIDVKRQLRRMRAYTLIVSAATVVVCGAAIGGSRAAVAEGGGTAKFDEIEVKRLSVIEENGKPRMVLTNKKKSPSAVVNGVELGNAGTRPGMIFYNGEGDESGGLTTDTTDADGKSLAYGHLSFDQYKQDQTLMLQYVEEQGKRGVGLRVQDRPDVPMTDYFEEFKKVQQMPPGPERDKARAALEKKYPAPQRVFLGKTFEKASALMLADGKGAPRIMLRVGEDGDPQIQFLDSKGKVTRTIKG